MLLRTMTAFSLLASLCLASADVPEDTSSSPVPASSSPAPISSSPPLVSTTVSAPSSTTPSPSSSASSVPAAQVTAVYAVMGNWTRIDAGGKTECGGGGYGGFGGGPWYLPWRDWSFEFDNSGYWSETFDFTTFKEDGDWFAAYPSKVTGDAVKNAKVDQQWRCNIIQTTKLTANTSIVFTNTEPFFEVDGEDKKEVTWSCNKFTT